ncbi:MAG TPA: asparagine synthase (glutamine-hydrolyzing) [Blastocatellia bacterium]|nr:asparagine synthase (glutamine-hydrolyzing) [Blastocatellia bacterium]
MCGVAGVVTHERQPLAAVVEPMIEAQRHRGPDGSGVWADQNCALGHRRLAIIDLSDAGRQPMCSREQTSWITYNGEVYNFESVRRELEGLGYGFQSRTDTEVVLRAFENWGVDCLERLRGMFAFAIWDSRRRRLFAARDRAGKKPLFYTHLNGRFLFASELQGLLAGLGYVPEVNESAIDAYLSLGYIPAPLTAFKNIHKLPPAHWITVEVRDSALAIESGCYWELDYGPKIDLDEQEAAVVLREKLTEAVKLRMISDVPLGAFLSGGTDSSIVVGLMAQLSTKPVKTFSIGFDQAAYNELDHAKRVADRFETDHHEFIVKPDVLDVLPTLVRHYGEPYADSSAIPTFYVSKLTRSEVTVALNGDGGDESFAGYERYRGNRIAERISAVPGSNIAAKALGYAIRGSVSSKNRLSYVKRFLSGVGVSTAERYGRWVGCFDQESKSRLLTPEFAASLNGWRPSRWLESLFNDADGLDPVDRTMAVDVVSYLPYDLLVKVDITSMANSLEARSPFLDHEVMEFAARLPVNMKLRGRDSKYLLKRAFADGKTGDKAILPAENASRRKMGFGVPVGDWLRGPLRGFLEDTLLSNESLGRAYFKPDVVRRLVSDHVEHRVDHSSRLWSLLMLEMWNRLVVGD